LFAPVVGQIYRNTGRGFLVRVTPTGNVTETTGSPRFLWDPIACMPRSTTPAKSSCDALEQPDVAFRLLYSVGFRDGKLSGLNNAAYRLPVYA